MGLRTRFAALVAAITRRLPFGLSEVIAPSLVGYLLINLCTFFLDVGLLGLFHGSLRLPIPVAVTLSYGTASVLSYVLNRVLNFGSHEAVGKQFPLYVLVSGSNYLIFVLGLTDLLSTVGVYYELARILAACCEAVYLYCMLRWVVFRDTGAVPAGTAGAEPPATEPPATGLPATGLPATELPATEPPATEPPATEPLAAPRPEHEVTVPPAMQPEPASPEPR